MYLNRYSFKKILYFNPVGLTLRRKKNTYNNARRMCSFRNGHVPLGAFIVKISLPNSIDTCVYIYIYKFHTIGCPRYHYYIVYLYFKRRYCQIWSRSISTADTALLFIIIILLSLRSTHSPNPLSLLSLSSEFCLEYIHVYILYTIHIIHTRTQPRI